jgi:hypothetical protein
MRGNAYYKAPIFWHVGAIFNAKISMIMVTKAFLVTDG